MDDARAFEPSGRTWAWVGDGTAVESITHAVAEAEGTSPTRLDPPLDDVIDPDALGRLFASPHDGEGDPASRVVFPYRGHEVTFYADGSLTVDPGGGA